MRCEILISCGRGYTGMLSEAFTGKESIAYFSLTQSHDSEDNAASAR